MSEEKNALKINERRSSTTPEIVEGPNGLEPSVRKSFEPSCKPPANNAIVFETRFLFDMLSKIDARNAVCLCVVVKARRV